VTKRKKLAILGSTGSVGRQSLEIVEAFPDQYEISILVAGRNIDLLEKQVQQFKPGLVLVQDTDDFKSVHSRMPDQYNIIKMDNDAFSQALVDIPVDLVINALPSLHGYMASISTVKRGINLALANKESLILAGDLLTSLSKKSNSIILPVDSEASAIFQCLEGEDVREIEKIYLTASGGPFYKNKNRKADKKTVLQHPVWSMGPKISVDSATMMNKAFEMFEIHQLFGLPLNKIEVIIHPESFVHSMIRFRDGQVKALISEPDMKYPIAHAMSYPQRHTSLKKSTDIFKSNWHFDPLRTGQFPCFDMAKIYLKKGGSFPAALVIVNDHFVTAFLNGEISFDQIQPSIQLVMKHIVKRKLSGQQDLSQYVKECQEKCLQLIKS